MLVWLPGWCPVALSEGAALRGGPFCMKPEAARPLASIRSLGVGGWSGARARARLMRPLLAVEPYGARLERFAPRPGAQEGGIRQPRAAEGFAGSSRARSSEV